MCCCPPSVAEAKVRLYLMDVSYKALCQSKDGSFNRRRAGADFDRANMLNSVVQFVVLLSVAWGATVER